MSPPAFWLQTAGQTLNESAGLTKAGASAQDSYPLPGTLYGVGTWFRFRDEDSILALPRTIYHSLWPRFLFFKRGDVYGLAKGIKRVCGRAWVREMRALEIEVPRVIRATSGGLPAPI